MRGPKRPADISAGTSPTCAQSGGSTGFSFTSSRRLPRSKTAHMPVER